MALALGPAVFYSICQEAGLTLGTDGHPNVLHVEPIRFERDTFRLLQRASPGSEHTESFIIGLQEHMEDLQNLRTCLVPVSSSSDIVLSTTLNESLIRMLLSIDILQSGLMDGLLDRIFGFLNEEQDSAIPKLILQQLKWLNNIIAPEQLTAKLFEVISMSPISIQRDIITSLPEILPDSEHRTVVLGLVELMESSSDLMVPILDALSNLNLQSDVLVSAYLPIIPVVPHTSMGFGEGAWALTTVLSEQVNARNHVMDKLDSAELDDLPIVIKFLLQTVEPDTVGDAIETIRNNLDFDSINKLQKNSKHAALKKTMNQTPEVLILDSLKTGIKFQKFVTDAWNRELSAISKPGQHKVIDVMIMFILHSIVSLKKKIEVMIRRKIIDGILTKKLLQETILVHGVSLREYMPAVLSISESLLRASANYPIVARTASVLYTCAFEVADAYYRQEIIGSLLVHIGSGSAVEIDASLAVLQNIAQVSRSTLNEYSAFLKGILDYLDNLSLEQIRLFFVVLGSLAREDETSGGNGTLLTDLNIIVRKQLSNPMENYKKIGVMGAIAIVQTFGVRENDSHERGSSSQVIVSHREAEADPLLKISVLHLQMVRDACRKSYVCLALTYDELASLVLGRDLDPKLVLWIKEEFSDQFAATFVNGESELSISIMPTLCADMSGFASQGTGMDTADGVAYLCSLFKLLQATEKTASEDGLDDIDGLLGCGITMFKKEYLEDIAEVYSTEICHTIAQGLLCAINWFPRIIIRLQQMTELEGMLRHVLKSAPGFRPLEANQAKVKDSARGGHSSNTPVDVFHVLRVHEPITREVYEISEVVENNAIQLRYPELLFLLKDLLAKVNYKLPAPTTHMPFGKKASVVADMNQGRTAQDSTIILDCLNISLKVLWSLFSWNEIKGVDQKEVRLELLKSLALDRLPPERVSEIQGSINLSTVVVEAFRNLSTWREMMPTFESAAMLLEILDRVLDLVPRNAELSHKASMLATETLSYRWPPSIIVKPDRLAYVLGLQIGCSNVRLKMINEYVTSVLPSFLDQDEGQSELHPMLNTNTFTVYTKVLHIQLTLLVSEFSEENFDDTQSALDHIAGLGLCFQQLATFVKSNDKREVLAVTLKHSKTFMEQFIKRVIPFLGVHFRGHQDAIAKIFKNYLQAGTRSLQKTMESLIFEVKLMLENNDAGAAFWLGNLKHRNLRGEEISSQLPAMSEDEQDGGTRDLQSEIDEDEGNGEHGDLRPSNNNPRKRSRTDAHKPRTTPRKARKDAQATGSSKKKRSSQRPRARVRDIDNEPRIHTKRYTRPFPYCATVIIVFVMGF
ncbi:Fanconi anemia group D2 protein [Modicella reniformis]|uniref:Fanconi anemia group D2 protein n=1 Tax=Modicella reniformis TaxID=1440133 RepID=A0A9P6J5H8_9FUNG|nr:Fanconi anemia group D2 protein [Modicella reniformis]